MTAHECEHVVSDARDRLAEQIGEFRRVALPGLLMRLAEGFAGLDLSLTQVAALYLMADEAGAAPTVRAIAGRIGRSMSATSRLVDQLVVAGLVDRREDPVDRRAKRLTLTERGRRLLHELEQTRAGAQLAVTHFLTDDEQRTVAEGMALLAVAARRMRDAGEPATTVGGRSDAGPAAGTAAGGNAGRGRRQGGQPR